MNLIDLKNYLIQVKITSLAALCAYFKRDADVVRGMLSHWIRKGHVRECRKTPQCGVKCGQCHPLTIELYEWVSV